MKKTVFISTLICVIFARGYTGFQVTATEPKSIQLADNNLVLRDSNGLILNDSNSKSKDNLIRIIVFMGLIATGSLFWYLLRSPKSLQANFRTNHNSETALLDRVSPKLRRQLLRLINDPKTANRLLVGIYKNNSDRSADWLAEKAIYDLKRGR